MAIGKKTRFEVFKRDKFTCQYCGRSAPDVILHVDHIHPKSKGGTDDIINLVTSCRDCNLGKRDRLLSDDAVIKKRKRQLEELQERREQLEMMMNWQRELVHIDDYAIDELSGLWEECVPGYYLTDHGLNELRSIVTKFSVRETAEAMRIAAAQYLEFGIDEDGQSKPTKESVGIAFGKIAGIIVIRRKKEKNPYWTDIYYIRGILRNRLSYYNNGLTLGLSEKAIKAGIDADDIKELACTCKSWTDFRTQLQDWTELAMEQDNG